MYTTPKTLYQHLQHSQCPHHLVSIFPAFTSCTNIHRIPSIHSIHSQHLNHPVPTFTYFTVPLTVPTLTVFTAWGIDDLFALSTLPPPPCTNIPRNHSVFSQHSQHPSPHCTNIHCLHSLREDDLFALNTLPQHPVPIFQQFTASIHSVPTTFTNIPQRFPLLGVDNLFALSTLRPPCTNIPSIHSVHSQHSQYLECIKKS